MSKVLVAYFSASGVTRKLAHTVAQAVCGELFEIRPETPYTDADLNWRDRQSRSSLEAADAASRPAVADKVEAMEQYDTIFVGFPIWWYVAPKIINTFLEQYNLRGKTIIPFATSGGSKMGKTNEALAPSCPGAILKEGNVFPSNAGREELASWAKTLRAHS